MQYRSVEVIGDLDIEILGKSLPCSISYLRRSENYNWCSELRLSDSSQSYGAVVARDDSLVNNNDFVAFQDDEHVKVL